MNQPPISSGKVSKPLSVLAALFVVAALVLLLAPPFNAPGATGAALQAPPTPRCPGVSVDITNIPVGGSVTSAEQEGNCGIWKIVLACPANNSITVPLDVCVASDTPVDMKPRFVGQSHGLTLSPDTISVTGCQSKSVTLSGTFTSGTTVHVQFDVPPHFGNGPGFMATIGPCPTATATETATATPTTPPGTATATPTATPTTPPGTPTATPTTPPGAAPTATPTPGAVAPAAATPTPLVAVLAPAVATPVPVPTVVAPAVAGGPTLALPLLMLGGLLSLAGAIRRFLR